MKLLPNFRKAALTLAIAASALTLTTPVSQAEIQYTTGIDLGIPLDNPSQTLYFNVITGSAWLGSIYYEDGAPKDGAHFTLFFPNDMMTQEPQLNLPSMVMLSAYLPNNGGGMLVNWGTMGPLDGIDRLAKGDLISGELSDENQGYSMSYYLKGFSGVAPWAPGDRGYIGFQFKPEDAVLYGWVDITYGSDMSLTLHGFGYEDNGSSIEAGAIPEPSSVILGMTAAGALAISALRRRKTAVRLE